MESIENIQQQMKPINPTVDLKSILSKGSVGEIYRLCLQDLQRLKEMLLTSQRNAQIADKELLRDMLNVVDSRIIQIYSLDCASLQKEKQKSLLQLNEINRQNHKRVIACCVICFLNKFDSIYAFIVMELCNIVSFIANYSNQHLSSTFNTQTVFVILFCLILCFIISILCIGKKHIHQQLEQEIDLNQEQQPHQIIDRIIKEWSYRDCFGILLSGITQIQKIRLKDVFYLQRMILMHPRGQKEVDLCITILDRIQISKLKELQNILKSKILEFEGKIKAQKKKSIEGFECQACLKCRFLGLSAIFVSFSSFVAIGTAEIAAWALAPLGQEFNLTRIIFIILGINFVAMLIQILCRLCRVKQPYCHKLC